MKNEEIARKYVLFIRPSAGTQFLFIFHSSFFIRTSSFILSLMIRRASLADSAAMASLAIELGYPCTPEEMSSRLEAMLGDDDHAALVAEREGHVVAWIHVVFVFSFESDAFCEIRGLVVTERLRGGGVGARMVEAAEEWARAKGVKKIRVRSNVVRERTHAFYERLGYSVTKSQKVFDKEVRS